MSKLNCWEVKRCGRQPGGERAEDLGVCPASVEGDAPGPNGGKAHGRMCWSLAGTLCGGAVQGTFAQKSKTCLTCEFFAQVQTEEGHRFSMFDAPKSRKR